MPAAPARFRSLCLEFIALAAGRGYETRIGFEDTLLLPDGNCPKDNGELVTAAREIIARCQCQLTKSQTPDSTPASGHGGGEYPAREHDDALLAGAGADENAALLVDRLADGRVNGARRDDGDGRVPNLRGNGRVRGAPSNAATLQRSSTEAPARKEAAVLRAIATARAARR